jgi:DNA repair exonuclease SbcCD ATPase subunit
MDKNEINKENVAAANANGIAAMGRKNGEREALTIEALNSLKEEIRNGFRESEKGAVNIASAIKKNTEEAKEKRAKLADLIARKAAGESVESEIGTIRAQLSGLRKDRSELESALKDISPIMSKVLTAEDRLRNNPGSIANQEAGAKAAPAAHAAPAADHGGGGGHGGGHDAGH